MSAHAPHVYSVEWNACERVFGVDGQEYHREQTGAAVSQHVVRSAATSDYEVVQAVDVVVPAPRLGSDHAPHARARAAAGRRRVRGRTP
jgi:hypothetical protein